MENTPEITARNRSFSFMKGWRDAAASRIQNEGFLNHSDKGIRDAYLAGWKSGRKALSAATKECQEKYSFEFSILRAAEQKDASREVNQ